MKLTRRSFLATRPRHRGARHAGDPAGAAVRICHRRVAAADRPLRHRRPACRAGLRDGRAPDQRGGRHWRHADPLRHRGFGLRPAERAGQLPARARHRGRRAGRLFRRFDRLHEAGGAGADRRPGPADGLDLVCLRTGQPGHHPYQYLAGPSYRGPVRYPAAEHQGRAGGSNVAFIFSNTEFGRDPIEHGKMRAEELGIEVVLEESTKPQGADIPTHVTKLAQSGAEYCILQGYVTGVWPQLIGGARQFGLPTQFMGTFWGMENFIADRVTAEAGPFLDGYQGVMPYRYFYDREEAPRYRPSPRWPRRCSRAPRSKTTCRPGPCRPCARIEACDQGAARHRREGREPLTADNTAEALSGSATGTWAASSAGRFRWSTTRSAPVGSTSTRPKAGCSRRPLTGSPSDPSPRHPGRPGLTPGPPRRGARC
jgi:hypothetical protein